MGEDYFLRCRVYAMAAWILAAVLIAAAWIMLLVDENDWRVAAGLGQSACAVTAVAVTLHVRSFMVRVSDLIRATRSAEGHEAAESGPRSLR